MDWSQHYGTEVRYQSIGFAFWRQYLSHRVAAGIKLGRARSFTATTRSTSGAKPGVTRRRVPRDDEKKSTGASTRYDSVIRGIGIATTAGEVALRSKQTLLLDSGRQTKVKATLYRRPSMAARRRITG